MLVTILLISVPLHVLIAEDDSKNQLSISTLIILTLLAIIFSAALLYLQHIKIEKELMIKFGSESLTGKSINSEELEL